MYLSDNKLFPWNAVKSFIVPNQWLYINFHISSVIELFFKERYILLMSDLQVTECTFGFIFCFIVKKNEL